MNPVSKPELINDLNKVYDTLDTHESLTMKKYSEEGEYSPQVVVKKFDDSWSNVLKSLGMYAKADLKMPGKNYSQDELEDMVTGAAKQCKGTFTHRYLNEHLPCSLHYCLSVLPDDGFTDLKDRLELHQYDEDPAKYWVQELKGEVGRFDPEEIKEMVNGVTDNMFVSKRHVSSLVEASEEVEGLTITSSQSGLNGSKVFVRTEGVDPFEKYKQDLPYRGFTEEWFDRFVSSGRSPKTTSAAIMYLMQEIPVSDEEVPVRVTQADVADALGVTPVSVRNVLDRICEEFSNAKRLREEIR